MKEKLKNIALSLMIAVTVLPISPVMAKEAMLTDSEISEGRKEETLASKVEDEIRTRPEYKEFQELRVGDCVYIESINNNDKLESIEVILGEERVSIDNLGGDMRSHIEPQYFKVHCHKKGAVKLEVNFAEECQKAPIELQLNIKEGKPLSVQAPSAIKLGENWKSVWTNIPYGASPIVYFEESDAEKLECKNFGQIGEFDRFFMREEYTSEYTHLYYYHSYFGKNDVAYANQAMYPGTITGTVYLSAEDCDKKQNSQGNVTVTIEEPCIKSNEPQQGTVGDTFILETSLENTAFKNVPLMDWGKRVPNGFEEPVDAVPAVDGKLSWTDYNGGYYIPKLEVIEGRDCITLQEDITKTTLSLQKKIQLKKPGTVKIKIAYVPSGTAVLLTGMFQNHMYQPEKIVTIQVKEKPVTVSFNSSGGSAVASQTIASGVCAKKPGMPQKPGYTFSGWYLKNAKFHFKNPVTENITLTARWKKVKVGKPTISSLKNKKAKTAALKFKAVKKAEGYRIIYATNKKFTKNRQTFITKKKSVTVKKLRKKATYYFRVCAYRTDSAGEKVYGKYSVMKKVKIRK